MSDWQEPGKLTSFSMGTGQEIVNISPDIHGGENPSEPGTSLHLTFKAQNASHMILIYSELPENTVVLSDVEERLDFDMFRALPRAVTEQSI